MRKRIVAQEQMNVHIWGDNAEEIEEGRRRDICTPGGGICIVTHRTGGG